MSEFDRSRFAPVDSGPTALFLDTSALAPLFTTRLARHAEAAAFFEALRAGDLPYRPLLTNQFVADELVSLLLSRADARTAADALDALLGSGAIRLLSVTDEEFHGAVEAFRERPHASHSLTDHLVAVQARAREVSHVFTYDDDFRSLGLTVVPA